MNTNLEQFIKIIEVTSLGIWLIWLIWNYLRQNLMKALGFLQK